MRLSGLSWPTVPDAALQQAGRVPRWDPPLQVTGLMLDASIANNPCSFLLVSWFPQLLFKVRKAGDDQYCAIAARLIVTCPPSTLMTSRPGTMTLRPKLAFLLNYEGTYCYPEEVEPLEKKQMRFIH